jgi:hypothetical protein
MAGSWIKLRHDIFDAPEMRRLARATGLDQDQVLGKLARFWSWADRHGVNGRLDVELEDVDDKVGHVGFGAALVSVGWLVTQEGGIVIPHWERHFSDSAKARALGAQRAERHRNGASVTHPPDPVTLTPLPDKRKTRPDIPPPPPREAAPVEAAAALRAAWQAASAAGHVQPYKAKHLPKAFDARAAEDGWVEEALRAIDHLPRCKFFDTPVTLIQLCGDGFVARVLAGQYDAKKPARAVNGHHADPPKRQLPDDFTEAVRRTNAAIEARRREVS